MGGITVKILHGAVVCHADWPLFTCLAVDAHLPGVANACGTQLGLGF